ncbi:MAG: tetratricopeptide repeat protein [Clostridia bacterium]
MTPEAEALKNEGNARKASGDPQGALEAYRRALALAPNYGAALYNAGLVLQEMGRPAEAEPHFRRLTELDSRDRDAWFRLGLVLAAQGRDAAAASAYRAALEIDPANPLLWLELGKACRASGDRGAAQESASRAIALTPGLPEAHNLAGMLAQDEGRFQEAAGRYRQASALAPEDAAYLNNLGCALGLDGAFEEAVGPLSRAVELAPGYVDAHANLGNVYSTLGRREAAVRCFREAYKLAPGDPARTADLLFELQHVCDWTEFDALARARRENLRRHPERRIDPFSLLSIPSTPDEQLAAARSYAAHIEPAAGVQRAPALARRAGGPRIRVGYLSADLHAHATAYLTAELFELHDRSRFEIFAYSYGADDGSPMRARLRRGFDRFVDIALLGSAEAAEAIRQDGVDILVDLKGYTTHARPGIPALRPAPVQVNWLGYPGTMGASFIDYLVGDAVVTPLEHAAHYSEKLVLLPGSYQANDRSRRVGPTPSRKALGLPEEAFVFCSFNQAYKILPETFAAWMRILAAVPASILWLFESNATAFRNLRGAAAAAGIQPDRLVPAPALPQDQHLGRLAAADLFLDTWPYNAHTTASDALWGGLPVVTWPGATFASRVGASLLAAVGLPELIAESPAAYERMAIRLAQAPQALATVREKLRANRRGSLLYDAPAFARALEKAYERMAELARAGRPPEHIVVR